MHRLEVRVVAAVAAARGEPEAAGERRRGVREQVAVKVRKQHDVELLRPADQAVREIVDDQRLELDVRVFPGHTLRGVAEQPVGAKQQVVLGGAGDLARPALRLAPPRQLEGESGHALAATIGDHLQRVGAGPEIGHRLLPGGARKPQRREVVEGRPR